MAAPNLTAASAAEGWRALDALLDETERMATADREEKDFFDSLFARLSLMGCSAAAVWTLSDGGATLNWQAGSKGELRGSDAAAETIRGGDSRRIEQSIFVVWKLIWNPSNPHDREVSAALETVWPATNGAGDGLLATLSALGPILTIYSERREHRKARELSGLQSQLEQFGRRLTESLDLTEVAYRIANDGRTQIGCERVAVAVRRGNRYRVLAVSGAEHIHRRSESVRQLETLCDLVAAEGRSLSTTDAKNISPQIETALGEYLDLSPATELAIEPIVTWTALELESRHKELAANDGNLNVVTSVANESIAKRPGGLLICEQYNGQFDMDARLRMALLPERCGAALSAAMQVAEIPGHRWWLALARDGRLQKYTSRSVVVTTIVALVLAVLFLIPAQVRVKARGELQPVDRREVFAPHDAVVTNVLVDHGAEVRKGDALLELRSPELDLELQKTAGELETVRKQLAAAQAEQLQIRPGDADQRTRQRRLTAEIQQLEEQLRGLDARQTMLADQRKELTVRSPLAGTVVTWNAKQRLASRPLRRGDSLLTVADESGPWRLELRVPARTAGRALAAPREADVDFVLTTDPGRSLTGKVKHVAERVETDEAGESFLPVTVEVDRDDLPNRVPGATVTARVHTGRSSLAVAWFHELWDAVRLWTMF